MNYCQVSIPQKHYDFISISAFVLNLIRYFGFRVLHTEKRPIFAALMAV